MLMYASVKINKFYKTKYHPTKPKAQSDDKKIYLANLKIDSAAPKEVNVNVVSANHIAQIKTLLEPPIRQPVNYYHAPVQQQLIATPPTTHLSAHKNTNKTTIVLAISASAVAVLLVVVAIGPGFERVANLLAML